MVTRLRRLCPGGNQRTWHPSNLVRNRDSTSAKRRPIHCHRPTHRRQQVLSNPNAMSQCVSLVRAMPQHANHSHSGIDSCGLETSVQDYYSAQSAQSSCACANTVCVAFSCLSGLHPDKQKSECSSKRSATERLAEPRESFLTFLTQLTSKNIPKHRRLVPTFVPTRPALEGKHRFCMILLDWSG